MFSFDINMYFPSKAQKKILKNCIVLWSVFCFACNTSSITRVRWFLIRYIGWKSETRCSNTAQHFYYYITFKTLFMLCVYFVIIILIIYNIWQMAASEQTESVGLQSDVQGSWKFGREGHRRYDLRGPVWRPMGEHGEADTSGAHPMTRKKFI